MGQQRCTGWKSYQEIDIAFRPRRVPGYGPEDADIGNPEPVCKRKNLPAFCCYPLVNVHARSPVISMVHRGNINAFTMGPAFDRLSGMGSGNWSIDTCAGIGKLFWEGRDLRRREGISDDICLTLIGAPPFKIL